MSTIDISRSYLDGEILFALDLDNIVDGIETFLNVTKLTDDNILNGSITGSLKLVNASVTNSKLATDSVDSSNIIDSAITTSKINDSAVTTDKINNAAVTNAKLSDDSIDSNNIINSSVTRVKLAAPNYQISSSSTGTFSTTSGSATAVTNATLSITLTGKPVLLLLQADGTSSGSAINITSSGGTTASTLLGSEFYWYRNGSLIATNTLKLTAMNAGVNNFSMSPSCVSYIDTSGTTGSVTYALYAATVNGSVTTGVFYCKIVAIEL